LFSQNIKNDNIRNLITLLAFLISLPAFFGTIFFTTQDIVFVSAQNSGNETSDSSSSGMTIDGQNITQGGNITNDITPTNITTTNNLTSGSMTEEAGKRNVIFIHPDGTTQSHYSAVRFLEVGPDGQTNWDKLPNVAIYKGHMKDALTSTSNGGATVHGSGLKVLAESYGCDGHCTKDSIKRTLLEEARDEGYSIGIINSGTITEPGTGAFVAHVTERTDHCGIVKQIVENSGAQLILGAGEKYYLSANDISFHPNPENDLKPDKGECSENMIDTAKSLGYTIVFNRTQLENIDITKTKKILGIFAYEDTYNDMSENELFDLGVNVGISSIGECDDVCQLYEPQAPTFDEMVDFGIEFLNHHSNKGFVLVAEEEGIDNFVNQNMNAEGMIEAGKRANRAIGVALEFAQNNANNTLVMTAADSDAGAAAIVSLQQHLDPEFPELDDNGCIITEPDLEGLDPLVDTSDDEEQNSLVDGITDFSIVKAEGVDDTSIFCEKPFVARPDQFGNELMFKIFWLPGGGSDVGGGTITRAYGCNSEEEVNGTLDNTQLVRIMADCLRLQDEPPFEP
jgi:alkaline phosphatase